MFTLEGTVVDFVKIEVSQPDRQVLQELRGSVLIQQVAVLLISSQIKISKRCLFDVLLMFLSHFDVSKLKN
jgi:hypothetical protein